MFALIAADRLYFKVDDGNRPEFAAAGSRPFTYRGRDRPIEMSYREVPGAVLDEPPWLADWAAKAYRAAVAAKAGRSMKRRKARL
jgi:DNA transformation protein